MRSRTLCLLYVGGDIQTFIISTAAVSLPRSLAFPPPTACLFTPPSVKSCLALGLKTHEPAHSFLSAVSWQENPSWFISSADESWWDKAQSELTLRSRTCSATRKIYDDTLLNHQFCVTITNRNQHYDTIREPLFLPLVVSSAEMFSLLLKSTFGSFSKHDNKKRDIWFLKASNPSCATAAANRVLIHVLLYLFVNLFCCLFLKHMSLVIKKQWVRERVPAWKHVKVS